MLLALTAGVLVSAGLFMMLRRSVVKLVIGLVMISHAANLSILAVGGIVPGRPPLVALDGTQPEPPYADPLPQALILTAIVISFGVQAFAVVLIRRTYEAIGTDDLNEMVDTDRITD